MDKITVLLLICFYTTFGKVSAQHNIANFEDRDIDTVKYIDKAGIHLLSLSSSGEIAGAEEGTRSSFIHMIHQLSRSDQNQTLWEIKDGVEDCPVDVEAKFLAKPRFTDFNNDGIKEVWMIYQTACKGDISPSTVIIKMMDERGTPYTLESTQLITYTNGIIEGGDYSFDTKFMETNIVYRDYALAFLREFYTVKWNSRDIFK